MRRRSDIVMESIALTETGPLFPLWNDKVRAPSPPATAQFSFSVASHQLHDAQERALWLKGAQHGRLRAAVRVSGGPALRKIALYRHRKRSPQVNRITSIPGPRSSCEIPVRRYPFTHVTLSWTAIQRQPSLVVTNRCEGDNSRLIESRNKIQFSEDGRCIQQ